MAQYLEYIMCNNEMEMKTNEVRTISHPLQDNMRFRENSNGVLMNQPY